MKRILVQMDDPVFVPRLAKTAKAPITIIPAGVVCQAELFLGPNDTTKVATSGLISFTSTGLAQTISFPVTMPAVGGSYHVYLDIYAGVYLLVAYISTEDVIIVTGSVGPITWV